MHKRETFCETLKYSFVKLQDRLNMTTLTKNYCRGMENINCLHS